MTKALVLLNMGGPRSKDELKMFLTNMFNDRRILTLRSDWLRKLIAYFIVKKRLDFAWQNYEAIGGKSPINDLTDELVQRVQERFPDIYVTQAMRYTPPFANKAMEEIEKRGIEEIILLPLYPQFSTTTTLSSIEDFLEIIPYEYPHKRRMIDHFYENKIYNSVIVDEIKRVLDGGKDFNIIFSAHGLPKKIVANGDPYETQVNEHVKILSKLLEEAGVESKSVSLAYQSKVGPLAWLEPSLEDKLKEFKDENVVIYPISFIVDNSETDFELSIEYEEIAKELGVKEYRVCKCVNYNDRFIDAIEELINE